ncbi:MAG: tetratricopeptide repeat protein [Myxococcota bacterium]
MHACPSCGSALDASQPLPPHCPYCGASLAPPAPSDLGAPPSFAGTPGESGAAPIFVPAESRTDLRSPSSLAAPRRRQPPPPAPKAGAVTGPPSIGLADGSDRHNEFDLGGDPSGMELAFGDGPVAEPEAPPGISLSAEPTDRFSSGASLSDPLMDLPSPVAEARDQGIGRPKAPPLPPPPGFSPPKPPPPPAPPGAGLPPPPPAAGYSDPVAEEQDHGLGFSAPVAGQSDHGIDLPSPVQSPRDDGIDLPSPVAAEARDHGIDLPSPVQGVRDDGIDLPSPVQAGAADDGSAYSLDLPAPIDTANRDLPAPVDLSLPVTEGDGLDLPIPADLPVPSAGGQEVQPAGQEVRPAGQEVRPAGQEVRPAGQEVRPAGMDVTPRGSGDEVAPHDLPGPKTSDALVPDFDAVGMTPDVQAAAATSGVAAPAAPSTDSDALPDPAMTAPTATPRAKPIAAAKPAVSRGVLLLGGGLLLLGAVGAAVFYSGLLDPEEPEVSAGRGAVKRGGGKSGDGKGTQTPGPKGAAAERDATVLAKFSVHTPASYLEALAATNEAGDVLGAAEAAFLLHYHYGPNPALATPAASALQAHASDKAGYVQRIVGLAALAAKNLEGAEASLSDDEPRSRLYRGWLRLAQERLDDAKAEADAVLAANANDQSAKHLSLAVAAAKDPAAALSAIEAATKANPEHAGLQALLAQTAVATGQLAVARTAVDAIDPAATDDPGVQAWAHVQRARVQLAQGDYDGALVSFDRALERVPDDSALEIERIHVLLDARRFNDASNAIAKLVAANSKDAELLLLQARVAVQSGDGDIALEILGKLAAAMPKDARVQIAVGDVHAMRLEIDQGQTAFAAARTLDPTAIAAATGEAVLLADAKQKPKALAVLEEAKALASKDGRTDDVVTLLVAIANLHRSTGDAASALLALDEALTAAPTHNDAQLLRGLLRLDEGRTAEGRTDLEAVFERTGGYLGLAGPLGRLYVTTGNFGALERLIEGRIRGEQTADDVLNAAVHLRLHQNRIADARALIDTALARHPSDWEAHMLLAQVLIAEGRAADALAAIERARPSQPQPTLMLQRGKVFEFNGKHPEALPEYRRALTIQPELHEARFLYGRLLAHNGANSKAIAELQQVTKATEAASAPWFPEVWVAMARAQQGLGKYDDAIASLNEATTLNPKFGYAFAEQGRYHVFRSNHAAAITALTKAIDLAAPTDHWYPDALINLARAQVKQGKNAAAKATLQKFLEAASSEHVSRAEAQRLLRSL